MDSVRSRLGCASVLWLLLASAAAAADGPVVQQIGEPGGSIAAAVAAEVTVVPLSPDLDARATPIILAAGKAFVTQDGKAVDGLEAAEQMALREAYDAGQPILLLDASTHDIEALHLLLEDGVALESSTDPVVLAYALRQENGVPVAQLVTHPVADGFGDDLNEDERGDAELALSQAIGIVVEELTRPPAVPEDRDPPAGAVDWRHSPIAQHTLTSTANGTYETPVSIYALHSCQENKDYYLVNTGGDWTPTQARYESADRFQISLDPNGDLIVEWQLNKDRCEAGFGVFIGEQSICRYVNYPLHYRVAIEPPDGPTAVRVKDGPVDQENLGDRFFFGLDFSIDGGVEVSGDGPSAGFQTGITWDNRFAKRVPPLVIKSFPDGPRAAGRATTYTYCTSGDNFENCRSEIQMTGEFGTCRAFLVGDPQEGQRPDGRLFDTQQTLVWQVDPSTYTESTFDITVSWFGLLATSTSQLWRGAFDDRGPMGYCNFFGCDCAIERVLLPPHRVSYTFKVPLPSSGQCPS